MARATKVKKPAPEPEVDDEIDGGDDTVVPGGPGKVKNYARGKGSKALRQAAAALYPEIAQSFDDMIDRGNDTDQNWNIYNALLDTNQQYQGFSNIYDPIVSDATDARTRRRLMQLFPANNVHINVIQDEGMTPWAHMALLESYIRDTQLDSVVRQDMIAGDVTGQWNLFVDWARDDFTITQFVRKNPVLRDEETGAALPDTSEDFTDVEDEEIYREGPVVQAFPDADLSVIPPTVSRIERADIVTIKLRLTKSGAQKLIDKGYLSDKDGDDLIGNWDNQGPHKDQDKQRVSDAGIKRHEEDAYALVYLAHTLLEIDGKKRPAWVFFTGPNQVGGIIKCPNLSGKPPVISAAQYPVGGSFRGRSKYEKVKAFQWQVNDIWAMASDSMKYSLMPIVMTDPLQNPNWASMVLGLAAVWPVDPTKTQFTNFPQLWRDALDAVDKIKARIWESMDVNETHVGRAPAGRKNAQQMAMMSLESNIPTMDDAKRYQQTMLEPLMERFLEMDIQYRREDITILQKGPLGYKAKLEKIEPQQISQRYWLQWLGVDYQQSLQRIQQQIAFINVLRGIPPQFLAGRRVEVAPMLENSAMLLFGPEIAAQTIVDERNLFTVDPHDEDEMMLNGFHVETHPADDDPKHLKEHMATAASSGDMGMNLRAHIGMHLLQMQKKAQAANPSGAGGSGAPGVPGGSAAGVPGTPAGGPAGGPRIGATPTMPRGGQGPAGRVSTDVMADPAAGG